MVAKIAEQKTAMYRHYIQQTGKDANVTIPIILHLLIQQLVCQDPILYRLIVIFQPNHKQRLISFPCFFQGTFLEEVVQRTIALPDTNNNKVDKWEKEDFCLFLDQKTIANLSSMISLGFLAVKDNLLSLKISSLGTIADLTLAHKELQAPAWHSIEETKKYNGLQKLFGAATKLENLKALSNVLIR